MISSLMNRKRNDQSAYKIMSDVKETTTGSIGIGLNTHQIEYRTTSTIYDKFAASRYIDRSTLEEVTLPTEQSSNTRINGYDSDRWMVATHFGVIGGDSLSPSAAKLREDYRNLMIESSKLDEEILALTKQCSKAQILAKSPFF